METGSEPRICQQTAVAERFCNAYQKLLVLVVGEMIEQNQSPRGMEGGEVTTQS